MGTRSTHATMSVTFVQLSKRHVPVHRTNVTDTFIIPLLHRAICNNATKCNSPHQCSLQNSAPSLLLQKASKSGAAAHNITLEYCNKLFTLLACRSPTSGQLCVFLFLASYALHHHVFISLLFPTFRIELKMIASGGMLVRSLYVIHHHHHALVALRNTVYSHMLRVVCWLICTPQVVNDRHT